MCVKPRNQKETDRAYSSQQKSGGYDGATGQLLNRDNSNPIRSAIGTALARTFYGQGIRFDETTAGKAANAGGSAPAQAGTVLGAAPKPMVQNTAAAATPRRRINGGSSGSAIPPGQNTLLGG